MKKLVREDAGLVPICAMFFVSGVAALLYQLLWQRSLFTIYGINIESVTVIVTAFMLGLGLGSLLGGWLSRTRLPLVGLFSLAELLIGVFGFFSLQIFHSVEGVASDLGPLATGLVTFALVLFPTMLMGMTLPLLTAYLVRRSGNVGRSVGLLYAVNTLGSAVACFAVAFVLMRLLGQQAVVRVAACLNLTVAAGALMIRRAVPVDAVGGEQEPSTSPVAFRAGLILSALSGYIALSYEILWYRVYSFTSGGSAHAFALLLGCYLLGIAAGSVVSRRFCSESHGERPRLALSAFIVAATLASFLVAPLTARIVVHTHWGTAFPLVIAGAGLLGAVFPLLCHLVVPSNARAGQGLARIYLANIVGSSAGSLVTGFVLMDHWSISTISVLLALLGLSLSAGPLFGARIAASRRRTGGVLLAGAAALVVIAGPAAFTGFYERLFYKTKYDGQRFAQLVESKSGVVSVTPDGEIHGGGVFDGRFSVDLMDDRNGIVRAYALGYLHPAPRRVLMIGLSSGSWAQVVANHPDVESLTVVEINPAYLDVIRDFSQEASVLDNPKVSIVIDDGRRWLRRDRRERFDFIVQNTSFHWRAHTTNLLSLEYHRLLRRALAPGGVFFYNTTWSDAAQRTGATSFPYALRLGNFMAVSDSPLDLDRDRWRRLLANYRIDGRSVFDLTRSRDRERLEDVLAIASRRGAPSQTRALDCEPRESILARTLGVRLITDDNMGTEWAFHH